MYQLLSIIFKVAAAEAVLVPLLLILQIFYIKNLRRTALWFIFATYLAGVSSVVGLPDVRYLTVDLGCNFVPFIDMVGDLKNALLNVVLFMPLGFLLPLFSEKFRSAKSTLLFGFGMTAAIEFLQIFTYRLTDVNDLITNTLGTFLGYFVIKMLLKKKKIQPLGEARDVFMLCAGVFCVMFAAVPFITPAFWGRV